LKGDHRVGPRILPIAIPVPHAADRVLAYLIADEPLTLIDTGPNTDAAYAAVRDGLARAGVGIDALERIVVTHAHIAHCGLAGRLHADSGARVAGHPLALGALEDFGAAWSERLDLIERAAAVGNVPDAVRTAHRAMASPMARLVADVPRDAMDPLVDGASLRLAASGTLSVVHIPGHSADHIGLHHPSSGTSITGDLVLRGSPTVPSLEPRTPDGARPATFDDLVASWRRIGRLPMRAVLPGHGTPIRAHRILLARRLAEARSALGATRDAVRSGAATLWDVAEATGLPMEPERLASTLGQVVARLDALVRRGVLARRADDGQLRFVAIARR